jgi:hypothetical protein
MGIAGTIVFIAAWGLALCAGQHGGEHPAITVRLENWAEASPVQLSEAQRAAGKIFRDAGFEINWLPVRSRSASAEPRTGATLLMRISQSQDFGYAEPSIGFRWERGPNDFLAIVFLDRVEKLARKWNVHSETAAVLGCAMAHELAHLLMGSEHSSDGIMKAEWNSRAVRLAAHLELKFTASQAAAMRDQLNRRVRAGNK